MAERKKIGLYYEYNKGWVAGAYYILNIIKALNELPDSQKPQIVVFYHSGSEINSVEQLNYPYITIYQFKEYTNFLYRLSNGLTRMVGLGNIFYDRRPYQLAEKYYPHTYQLDNFSQKYFWIPDFQEEFYPEFFSPKDIEHRRANNSLKARSGENIIFSSEDAKANFLSFYPDNKSTLHVLQFASVLSKSYEQTPINDLLGKYNIDKPYFIISNQFWRHKNHITVLKAIVEIKKEKNDVCFVFTGQPKDTRDINFFNELTQFCVDNKINDYIKFLGFIDRDEQLQLMCHSEAIIQPSLFEGWSTTVEDAKFLNKFIILSDIPVHREQMQQNAVFFEKQDAHHLAAVILKFIRDRPSTSSIDYQAHISRFANKFVNIMS